MRIRQTQHGEVKVIQCMDGRRNESLHHHFLGDSLVGIGSGNPGQAELHSRGIVTH